MLHRFCGAHLPLGAGTRHTLVTSHQAGFVTRKRPDRIAVEGTSRAEAQDNVRAIARDGTSLINADGAAIVAENANGIVPDGHAPGNQLGYGTGILRSRPLGIVFEQNRAGDIAETGRATKP
jgi:hypothetical protein